MTDWNPFFIRRRKRMRVARGEPRDRVVTYGQRFIVFCLCLELSVAGVRVRQWWKAEPLVAPASVVDESDPDKIIYGDQLDYGKSVSFGTWMMITPGSDVDRNVKDRQRALYVDGVGQEWWITRHGQFVEMEKVNAGLSKR